MFPLAVPYGWSAELCEEAMKEKAPLLYKEFCEARFIFVKHLARFHRQSRAPSDEVTLVTMGRHAQRGFAAISRRVGIASSGAMAHICALLDHRIIMGEPWYQETFITCESRCRKLFPPFCGAGWKSRVWPEYWGGDRRSARCAGDPAELDGVWGRLHD